MSTFYKNFIALIGVFALFFSSYRSFSQGDKSNIDSIKAKVARLSSDSEKVNQFLDDLTGVDCDDSLKKLALAFEAKKLAESIKWQKGLLRANSLIGRVYFECEKNNEKGFEYYQLNVNITKKNNDIVNQAKALENIAGEYDALLEQKKAIDYYDKALDLHPGLELESTILGNIGAVYKEIGDYGPAQIYFDSSLKLITSAKMHDRVDSNELAGLYLDKGDLYLANLEPDKASVQYQIVLGLSASHDKVMQSWALTGMGKSYRMKKDYQHAIEQYERALRACQENDNTKFDSKKFQEEVKIKDELSSTYLETWQMPQAQAYADSALSLAEGQHFISLLSRANATMGDVYLRQNRNDLAISYLQTALGIAIQTSNVEDKRDVYESLFNAYKAQGKYHEAFDALENYYSNRDSLRSIEKTNEFTKSDLNFTFRQEKFEDSLRAQSSFEKKIERQRVYTYSGFIGFVLVLLLSFFVYRSYVTQKKYNQLLAVEKKRHLAHIEAQSNILSDIADTQAHQVRGPISTILGLVHIFNYEDPTDPMNKQVMEWITSTTEKLDAAVKDVIIRENKLRSEHDESESDQV